MPLDPSSERAALTLIVAFDWRFATVSLLFSFLHFLRLGFITKRYDDLFITSITT